MTYEEINLMIAAIAEALGCGYSYYTNDEAEVVKTPFLLFDYPERDDVFADNTNYQKKEVLSIEYDSARRDLDAETIIEDALNEYGLSYEKTSSYINGENAFETMYTMQVMIKNVTTNEEM